MLLDAIISQLQAIFAAPLPEAAVRRLVFWYDEEKEFELLLEEGELPEGVKLLRLNGVNNFAVKKLLEYDDPTGNYLIYKSYWENPEDNWLRHSELGGVIFRADFISLILNEQGMNGGEAMRKAVELWRKFFESKERKKKLFRSGRRFDRPGELHLGILGVLAGVPQGDAAEILTAILCSGTEENPVVGSVNRFGNADVLRRLIEQCCGYREQEEELNLSHLTEHVLLSAFAHSLSDSSVLRGLETEMAPAGSHYRAFCFNMVSSWMKHEERREVLAEYVEATERKWRLAARFEDCSAESLKSGDVFPSVDACLLKRMLQACGEGQAEREEIRQLIELRRTKGWYARFADFYDCLAQWCSLQEYTEAHVSEAPFAEAKEVWNFYLREGYRADQMYRRFLRSYGRSLQSDVDEPADALKLACESAERMYTERFLKPLTRHWLGAAEADLSASGAVSGIEQQEQFYERRVRPRTGKKIRSLVIISDALRYEVAQELQETLVRQLKGNATLEAVQGIFPSITKCGMAALLPHRHLGIDSRIGMEVTADGMKTQGTDNRCKVLQEACPESLAIQATELNNMSRSERRNLFKGKRVVYVYHNTIDAIGDKPTTEYKVPEACEQAVEELVSLVRQLCNDLPNADIMITADHGFLYSQRTLEESERLGRRVFCGDVQEVGRRYALAHPKTTAEYLLTVDVSRLAEDGAPLIGFAPREIVRLIMPGGGERYVHGGVSLQELAVPLITYKDLKASDRRYEEIEDAGLEPVGVNRKITNMIFTLELWQTKPVGGKVAPCTYTLCMMDEDDQVISDQIQITADRTSKNGQERVFRAEFHLNSGSYSASKNYRLVIAREGGIPQEYEYSINIFAGDDYGFDL